MYLINRFTDSAHKDDDDLLPRDSAQSNPPRSHRKDDDSDKRDKKLWNNAKEIASTASWFLTQLSSRIRTSESLNTYYYDYYTINQAELDWYSSRITARAVLSIVALSYSLAPEWEPLPKIHLSQGDLDIIARREEDHIDRIKKARTMANSLLVRIGQNATEQDHLVEYGKNSTAMIHEQLQKKRRANTSSTRQSSKHVYYKCDIASCGSLVPSDLVGCCKANVVCNSYRFCSNHLDHDSHTDVNVKRSCREKYDSSMSVVDDLHHIEESGVCVFLCDIKECIEPALQSSAPCEHQHCGNYVFCDMHQLHQSHSIGHTMRSKSLIELPI